MNKKVYILLPDIRSAYNVGSIFRSADCFAIDKIYMYGTTPIPVDRFGRSHSGPQKEIAKTALGAEKKVYWEQVNDLNKFLRDKKKEGFSIISIEQDKRSISVNHFLKINDNKNILIIFGNEVNGIDKNLLKKSDYIIEIPMKGSKESLNVSVCAGLIMYLL